MVPRESTPEPTPAIQQAAFDLIEALLDRKAEVEALRPFERLDMAREFLAAIGVACSGLRALGKGGRLSREAR